MDELDHGATITGLQPGQKVFARYTLNRVLGRGGMGVVWLARDGTLGRDAALKFLPEVVAGDRAAIEGLKREVRRAIALAHPHIVKIHDFVTDGRTAAVSMEYVEGDTLASLRLDEPGQLFAADRLAPWVAQLCAALDYAHRKGRIVHRDLKPANLMIDAEGDLKVLDFGLAATLAESVSQVSRQSTGSGTPAYMSPQQLRGLDPELSDDLYALGATLYDLLAGQPPFRSTQSSVLMHQVLNEAPQGLNHRRVKADQPPVPPEWEETIMALLAKEPADRPQSAGEVAERLGLAGGMATKSTRGAKNEVGAVAPNGPVVERLAPKTLSETRANALGATRSTKTLIIAGIAAGVLLLTGTGYYFGVYAPEQKRLAEMARLEAQGRFTEAAQLRNAQEKAAAETARLAAARGDIVIRTNPSGAEVRVGAIALERSPMMLKDQKPGKYPVRIRREGYDDWNGETEVKENDFTNLDVALVRSTGRLLLQSEPTGAEVTLIQKALPLAELDNSSGKSFRTPIELKLDTGTYDLTFRLPNWPVQKQTIEVARNQSLAASAEFVVGGLELTSTPAGAAVWQNGRRVGVTPYQVADIIPGRYDFELKLKGYQPATVGLTVAARQTMRETVTLEKLRGPRIGQAWTIPDLNLTIMPIAPGTFQMGSTSGDQSVEKPSTRVTLTKPFWLGQTEVTQAQWSAVMGSSPSHFKGDNLPVEQVSWNDAVEFCRKLTEMERAAGRLPEGYAYTLPTEAQWEYSCRAGTTGDYAGNLDSVGWYSSNSGNTTHLVGQKQANAWGLHDMHGNVWEWCADWKGDYPGGGVTDPTGPPSGTYRVFRGGGWGFPAVYCRSACRGWFDPGSSDRGHVFGFRLALAPSL